MTAELDQLAGRVVAPTYRLELDRCGRFARLSDPAGRTWAKLCLLASLDTAGGRDETLALEEPTFSTAERQGEAPVPVIRIERRSTLWRRASLVLECHDDALVLRCAVEGSGRLTTASLLGGRLLAPDALGFLHSGTILATLFSPNPEDPRHPLRSAGKPAVVGVTGDSLPGRGHWFFTPAPFLFALSSGSGSAAGAGSGAGAGTPPEGWLAVGLLESVDALGCTAFGFVPADEGFHVELDYEGHQEVDGVFAAPPLLLLPGAPDPYEAIARQRERLEAAALVPARRAGERAAWWSGPMFCGWGAQCHLARLDGRSPKEHCSEQDYDAFLSELAGHGVVPATVVVDDGWQRHYGLAEPDEGRWPDLRGWIADRHRAGQRVLLWWKAWDPEGLPADWCVTTPDGTPVALDPSRPAAAAALGKAIAAICSPDGLDADGLKVDFTARTPSGSALSSGSSRWGVALLHDHLEVIYRAAKSAKADALVITHTPNPGFSDVSDMIRLNDMLRLDEESPESPLVTQMRYRAAVARAACPDLLIDTDDWCAPNREQWREYLAIKAEIGVPALYYSTHLDRTGEPLEEQDYAALRWLFARAPSAAAPATAAVASGDSKE